MPHESKLAVFEIILKPLGDTPNTNRMLFRCITGQNNRTSIPDSVLFMDVFKKFISSLDTPEMYKDPVSKKTMTANQTNTEDPDVEPNITPAVDKSIIYGVLEGGTYGRRRRKTSTQNKSDKTQVHDTDAITDDFFFLVYMPPKANKSILMVQSYTDETIAAVLKKFWQEFFKSDGCFDKPKIVPFYPDSIASDFKKQSVVTRLDYTTTIPGQTLIDDTYKTSDEAFKVTVKIEPIKEMTVSEYETAKSKLALKKFGGVVLGAFKKRKGVLKDKATEKTTPFELDTNFDIQPTIFLHNYIDFKGDGNDHKLIYDYCLKLLNEEIIPQIYKNAVVER